MNDNETSGTFDSIDTNSRNLILPISLSLTELNSRGLMDSKYETDELADVDFRPGADFEVDDTLFQGVNMREDFLDFGMSYTDHAYCNVELEASARSESVSAMLEVGNEEEIQEEVTIFQDVDGSGTLDDGSQPAKKQTKFEETKHLNAKDDAALEEKKKVPIIKTYNMRSKRLAVDDGSADGADKGSGGKAGLASKKRNVDQNKIEKSETTSDEEEEEEDNEEEEECESDDEVTVQSKRKQSQAKKGTAAKKKGKAKVTKGKKSVKGKQAKKKAAKADSDGEDEEDEEEEEPVTIKSPKKTNAKGKAGGGKRKGRPRKKPETESSEEEEEEEEEEDSESDNEEMEEQPQKSGKPNLKRVAKGKSGQPSSKKRKVVKKLAKKAIAEASDSDETSSDSIPLQEMKKLGKRKADRSIKTRQKMKKEELEESSEEEGDANADNENVEAEKEIGRDPILSTLTKASGVFTDDSASICSNDGSTSGVRSSSRIKKPNPLYLTGSAAGKVTAAAQKKEKSGKGKNKDQVALKEPSTTNLDMSETTDTDALVIDESPVKVAASLATRHAPNLPLSAEVIKAEQEQQEENEEKETENEEEDSKQSADDSQLPGSHEKLEAPEEVKRSARLRQLEEANQEKFKALRAERERVEVKNDAQKRRSLEKSETEEKTGEKEREKLEKEDKSKQAPKQVSKEAVKQPAATVVKNPCRGPNCTKGSLMGSVYCSDICIQNHAEESIGLIEQERQKSQPQRSRTEALVILSKSDERIVVFERKTGKLLTGPVAPTESTLLAWLKKHPTFEVLQPSHHSPSTSFISKKDKKPEKKMPVKEVRPAVSKETAKAAVPIAIQNRDSEAQALSRAKEEKTKTGISQSFKLESSLELSKLNTARSARAPVPEMTSGSSYMRGAPDPARISIRNTLRETLLARANDTDDVMLSGPEIKRLALDIEQELFGYYEEVNTKYKHKYRTLITHLKDPTNKGLFRKVLFGEIKPNRLVRLSSENLGSRELAYWKEPKTKTLQENVYEPKPVKKADFNLPPKSPFYDPNYDYLSSIIVDTTSHHGNHFFDINCKICTGKIPEPLYYDTSKSSAAVTAPKEDSGPSAVVDAEPVAVNKPTKDDEYVSSTIEVSRDPRRSKAAINSVAGSVGSSLTIVTSKAEEKSSVLSPPSIVSPISANTPSQDISSGYQMGVVEPLVLWKGSVYAHDVAKVMVCAYLVSGSLAVLKEDLSDLIVISGRLPPDNIFYYLSQIKQSGTFNRDVAVVRFESAGLQDDDLYSQLFSYLHSRDRCGVVSGCSGPTVKDMYIVPVASRSGLPSILLPLDGPGLSDSHPNLLLGVIVKHTSKRPSLSSPTTQAKSLTSTKTWMYSERSEMKEERHPEARRHGVRRSVKQPDVAADQKSETVADSRVLLSSSSASKLAEVGNAESSGASDVDDHEDLSEVARKDPIISKYSKFDKNNKKSLKKSTAVGDLDDEKPYDPFEDEDDKPYDPCSPEFVPTTVAETTASAAKSNSSSAASSSSAANSSSAALSLQLTTSSAASSVDLSHLFKPVVGLSSATDMTATMLTTLAAISSTSSIEEQQRLLSELTEKINEQQLHLDREKEDLKKDESLRGLTLPPSLLTSAVFSSNTLAGSDEQGLHNQPHSSNTYTSTAAWTNVSQRESSSLSKASTEILSLAGFTSDTLKSAQMSTSVLSQMPFDSGAIRNLARKRLALKAGDSHPIMPKQDSVPPVADMHSESSVGIKEAVSALDEDNFLQNVNVANSVPKAEVKTQQTFSCNLSILPPSIQQLLSGSSFENLKNIVANVTGKKIADGASSASTMEPNMTGSDFGDQMIPGLGMVPHGGVNEMKKHAGDEKLTRTLESGSNAKTLFASNMHGDVDYRVHSSSTDIPSASKTFENITSPSASEVSSFLNYSLTGNSQMKMGNFAEAGPQFQIGGAFWGGMSASESHPVQRSMELKPFRPSMQALLETPGDPGSRVSLEGKPPLLKTPHLSTTSDQVPSWKSKPLEMNQPLYHPSMQHPPFPPDMPRPPFPMDMQHPRFHSDVEKAPFAADGSLPQSQKPPFRSDVSKPSLMVDVPLPPFPPQISRPPFPPGVQRPPFLPEPPRPPFMLENLRPANLPRGPPLSGGNESQPPNSASRFTSPGLLPLPMPGKTPVQKQTDSSARVQDDYSSPSDRYFTAQPIRQVKAPTPTSGAEPSSTTDPHVPFAIGDFLKLLDNTNNSQGLAQKSSPQSTNNSTDKSGSSKSASDDANLRERKVLLPTPSVQPPQKVREGSKEKKTEKSVPGGEHSSDQKHGHKKPEVPAPATVRRWSAKSDWEKNTSGKSGRSDSHPVIVIDDDSKTGDTDELKLIPLPPSTLLKDGKADNGQLSENKADENKAENNKEIKIVSAESTGKDKSNESHKSEKRSSPEQPQKGRSTDRSQSRSRKDSKDHARRRSRSRDRRRKSRSQDRSQRHRSRSRERLPSSYSQRSRERRSDSDQQRRSGRDQKKHTLTPTGLRKRGTDSARERNRESRNKSDQNTSQANWPGQGSAASGDVHGTRARIPSLMDMIESKQSQPSKPPIPSLLDLMGVSRSSVSQARASSDLKQDDHNVSAAGSVEMKYRRDYNHGTDSEEGNEHERTHSVKSGQSAEARDFGRPALGGQNFSEDIRRPDRLLVEQSDLLIARQGAAVDLGGRTLGAPKRPLIEKPPERDFDEPEFMRPHPDTIPVGRSKQEGEQEVGFRDGGSRLPNTGYRRGVGSERFAEREGRHRDLGPEGSQKPGDSSRMHPFQSRLSIEETSEKFVYGTGGINPMDESDSRLSNFSTLKKSLLGDYPGAEQESEELSDATGYYEQQPRDADTPINRERNITPDERYLGRPALMPEPYQTREDRQTTPGVVRPPFPRFPYNTPGIRSGFGQIPLQRPQQVPFDERGSPLTRPRMPPPFGVASSEQRGPTTSESQPWRNSVATNRHPENRAPPLQSLDADGDSIAEKKTLLPMPPVPGPRLTEMPTRMTAAQRPMMPPFLDGPQGFARRPGPAVRMLQRFPQHRPMGFSEGPHHTGQRPQMPGDPRPRGPMM